MKLKNKILLLGLLSVQSVFSVIGVRAVYDEIIAKRTDFYVVIDGYPMHYTNPVVTIDDCMYVPLRETFENLNSEVIWRRTRAYVYTQDWYDEIKTGGYIYHSINQNIPLNKAQLVEDGLKKAEFHPKLTIPTPDGKVIEDVTVPEKTAEGFSEILNATGGYRSGPFKDSTDYYFELYSLEDVWVITPQRKVVDIVDWEAWYTIDKNTGEVEEDDWLSGIVFSYYLSQKLAQ